MQWAKVFQSLGLLDHFWYQGTDHLQSARQSTWIYVCIQSASSITACAVHQLHIITYGLLHLGLLPSTSSGSAGAGAWQQASAAFYQCRGTSKRRPLSSVLPHIIFITEQRFDSHVNHFVEEAFFIMVLLNLVLYPTVGRLHPFRAKASLIYNILIHVFLDKSLNNTIIHKINFCFKRLEWQYWGTFALTWFLQ